MISRKRCRAIAFDWVVDQGSQEYDRRMHSLNLRHASDEELKKLYKMGAEMLLQGLTEHR